jgi:hypothetical protein
MGGSQVERASGGGRALGGRELARVVAEGGAPQELLARAVKVQQEVLGAGYFVLGVCVCRLVW